MLLDKLARHLYRRNLGEEETYSIIDPMMYLDDIYTDYSLSHKVQEDIEQLNRDIVEMDSLVEGAAPVISVAGRTGDVQLDKSDIKRTLGMRDDGLSRVNNTSDINKPPSTAFQRLWMDTYNNMILPTYNDMMTQIYPYRIHVSGNGGMPIQNNPHRVLLSTGIWYGSKLIILDPNKFLHRSLFEDELAEHNRKSGLDVHTIIQDITKPGIGGNPPGTLYQAVQKLSDREAAFSQTVVPTIDSFAKAKIDAHNIDVSAHHPFQQMIQDEYAHLNEIHAPVENPQYEYVSHKVSAIDEKKEYTNEYPTCYAVNDAIQKREHTGLIIGRDTYRPSFTYQEGTDYFSIRTSDGKNDRMKVNRYNPNTRKVIAAMDAYHTSSSELSYSTQCIIALSKVDQLSYWQSGWTDFKLDLSPKPSQKYVTMVGVADNISNINQMTAALPFYQYTGLDFMKNRVAIHRKNLTMGDLFNIWKAFELREEADLLFQYDGHVVNKDRRILCMTVNKTDQKGYPMYLQSFDYDDKPTTVSPMGIGYETDPAQYKPLDNYYTDFSNKVQIFSNVKVCFYGMHSILCPIGFSMQQQLVDIVVYMRQHDSSKYQGNWSNDTYIMNTDTGIWRKWTDYGFQPGYGNGNSNEAYNFRFSFKNPPYRPTPTRPDLSFLISGPDSNGDVYAQNGDSTSSIYGTAIAW